MKKLQLLVVTGITALLSSCACECDDEYPTINIQFEGFTASELKTIYVINAAALDTSRNFMVFTGNSATLGVASNSQYQLKSDSFPLDKIIRVNEIRTETAKFSACDCTNITGIDYELDGAKYTDEPVVITK